MSSNEQPIVGEQYRLVFLEEDLISSHVPKEAWKECEKWAGKIVTVSDVYHKQSSTREVSTGGNCWYFNNDCFIPVDSL